MYNFLFFLSYRVQQHHKIIYTYQLYYLSLFTLLLHITSIFLDGIDFRKSLLSYSHLISYTIFLVYNICSIRILNWPLMMLVMSRDLKTFHHSWLKRQGNYDIVVYLKIVRVNMRIFSFFRKRKTIKIIPDGQHYQKLEKN